MIDFNAFHKLSYGLYLICSEHEGRKAGYAANTAFQVTSSPACLAISCNKNNYSCAIIEKKKAFSLSVLARDLDVSLIGTFGFQTGWDIDKFTAVRFKTGVLGVPVITESTVADYECKVVGQVDLGSHILFVGEVAYSEILTNEPTLTYDYYHEHYKMLSPRNAPTYIDPNLLIKEDPTLGINDLSDATEHICIICGYVYHPEMGELGSSIPPGTRFEDLPDDFECPICRAGKSFFKEL